MTKRVISILLALVLLVSVVPQYAAAEDSGLGPRPLSDGEEYQTMTTSESMVNMIKVFEGFRPEPYWDVSQWSIGYGSSCGTDRNNKPDITMTEPEAAEKLVELLETNYGKSVNDFFAKIRRQPTQQQFDALVDFTYNLGGGWTSDDNRLTRWLKNPAGDLELVDAMGVWSMVDGQRSYSAVMRRIREAIVFLKGEYSAPRSFEYIPEDFPVVPNSEMPYYKAGFFMGGGGSFGEKSDTVRFFRVGEAYGSFPTPQWENHELTGWNVVAVNNDEVEMPYGINTDAVVEKNLAIEAMWRALETEPVEPEETEPPTEAPTAPEETEPPTEAPTAPEETEPPTEAPTEPEVTEPPTEAPTEPEETEPPTEAPTEPEETEPPTEAPTEPEETEPPTEAPTEPEVTEPPTEAPTEPEATEPPAKPEPSDRLPFVDVRKSDWFHDPVQFVYERGYMAGTSASRFSPQNSMTRGMLVTVLYAIDGSPAVTDAQRNAFVDTRNDYYTDAVAWAKANGIVSGVSETRFAPNNRVTRQDAVAIFYQYCVNYRKLDGSASASLGGFVDVGRVADYAVRPMKWAVAEKLVSGTTSGSGLALNPRGNLTRAESATILRALVTGILEN